MDAIGAAGQELAGNVSSISFDDRPLSTPFTPCAEYVLKGIQQGWPQTREWGSLFPRRVEGHADSVCFVVRSFYHRNLLDDLQGNLLEVCLWFFWFGH